MGFIDSFKHFSQSNDNLLDDKLLIQKLLRKNFFLSPDSSIEEAIKNLRNRSLTGMPVVDNDLKLALLNAVITSGRIQDIAFELAVSQSKKGMNFNQDIPTGGGWNILHLLAIRRAPILLQVQSHFGLLKYFCRA